MSQLPEPTIMRGLEHRLDTHSGMGRGSISLHRSSTLESKVQFIDASVQNMKLKYKSYGYDAVIECKAARASKEKNDKPEKYENLVGQILRCLIDYLVVAAGPRDLGKAKN